MNISFFRKDAADVLRKSIPETIGMYSSSEEPWVESFFSDKNIKIPIFETEIATQDVELIKGGAENDSENAIRLYEAFRGKLLPVQAADRRLWAFLTHVQFWDYMQSRWPVENKLNEKGTNGTVTDRYFLSRGCFRNGISRLYWLADFTYDDNLPDDPYEYTKFLLGDQDLINQIEGYSLCRNRKVLLAVLKSLKEKGPLTESQTRLFFENICKIGGVSVLDTLPQDLLDDICAKSIDRAVTLKHISNGSKVTIRSVDDSNHVMKLQIKNGKAYIGKTEFATSPNNLSRLTVGKEIGLRSGRFIITEIE